MKSRFIHLAMGVISLAGLGVSTAAAQTEENAGLDYQLGVAAGAGGGDATAYFLGFEGAVTGEKFGAVASLEKWERGLSCDASIGSVCETDGSVAAFGVRGKTRIGRLHVFLGTGGGVFRYRLTSVQKSVPLIRAESGVSVEIRPTLRVGIGAYWQQVSDAAYEKEYGSTMRNYGAKVSASFAL